MSSPSSTLNILLSDKELPVIVVDGPNKIADLSGKGLQVTAFNASGLGPSEHQDDIQPTLLVGVSM